MIRVCVNQVCQRLSATALPSTGRVLNLPNGEQQFHTSSSTFNISKKMLSKTRKNRFTQPVPATVADEDFEEKAVRPEIEAPVLKGHVDGAIFIPSAQTMEAMVDGVRFDQLPIVAISAKENNTHITVTDYTGAVTYVKTSCGVEGFKNIKQSSTVAAQATGLAAGTKSLDNGIKTVRVLVKGIGSGRRSSVEGLKMSGLNIVSITDDTVMPTKFPKPRKTRKL